MLIIAIPKSASTSLLATLGEAYKLHNKQLFFPAMQKPNDFKRLAEYHSDIRAYPPQMLNVYANETRSFFKQHIPPLKNHIMDLATTKKVYLSREPADIVDAYYRAEQKSIHEPRPEFTGCTSLDEWRDRAKEIGLLEELQQFNNGWLQEEGEHTLHIDFETLVNDTSDAVRKVASFFGLPPIDGDIALSRKRYSRAETPQATAVRKNGSVLNRIRRAIKKPR